MKTNDKIGIAAVTLLIAFACYYTLVPSRDWSGEPYLEKQSGGFAVVELFTSEGCSSCPPADELLAQIQNEISGKDIFLLAFHVDYWDHQSWKDQFGSAQFFTARQQEYSQWMKQNVLYTPQFVINGVSEFGGDDARTLYSRISKALEVAPTDHFELSANGMGNVLEVRYKTKTIKPNSKIQVALVQKTAVSEVARGENSGKLLHHVQIVRALESMPLDRNSGTFLIKKPVDFVAAEWEIVGFLQDNATGMIGAAAKTNFNL